MPIFNNVTVIFKPFSIRSVIIMFYALCQFSATQLLPIVWLFLIKPFSYPCIFLLIYVDMFISLHYCLCGSYRSLIFANYPWAAQSCLISAITSYGQWSTPASPGWHIWRCTKGKIAKIAVHWSDFHLYSRGQFLLWSGDLFSQRSIFLHQPRNTFKWVTNRNMLQRT